MPHRPSVWTSLAAVLILPGLAAAQAQQTVRPVPTPISEPQSPCSVAIADDVLPGGDSARLRCRLFGSETVTAVPAPTRVEGGPLAFTWPVATPLRRSSGFGLRHDPIDGDMRFHAGVDLPGPRGAPVNASAPGSVVYAGWSSGYGNLVEIDHGDGLVTRYGHLDRVLVRSGMPVRAGQTLGLLGSTGRSTGPHLHFELRLRGTPLNPDRMELIQKPALVADPVYLPPVPIAARSGWSGERGLPLPVIR